MSSYKVAGPKGWRINILSIIIFAIFSLVFLRVFYISYIRHEELSETAKNQYERAKDSQISRGEILLKNNDGKYIVAAGKERVPYLYVIPRQTIDPEKTANQISLILPDISREDILKILSKKNDPFELISKNISEEKVSTVHDLNFPNIKIGYEEERSYPLGNFLSHVIGFLGFEGDKRIGQYGLEGFYDHLLKEDISIVLTIDSNIQSLIEASLNDLMKKWSAPSGTIIVEDPNTGAILGMVSSPSFNPKVYNKYELDRFINSATQEMFEPGSTFKGITMSAGIDTGKISPLTQYEDSGIVVIGGYTIKNFDEKAYGAKTMTQVLEKSLNTGAVFVQNLLGNDTFLNYVVNFGFGKKTEIDLGGEAQGDVANLYSGRKINFATASFGQGIAVTPIQLINAYSAIANGGKLMRPYVVDEIIYSDGQIKKTAPNIVGIPITEKTSAQLKAMLVNVVENGFDKVRIPGYDIAAKTGTAQIPEAGGYSDKFVHDMIGFAPAFSSRFTILIKIDKPEGIRFAADSLSPTMKNITKFLLNYYNIPPTKQ